LAHDNKGNAIPLATLGPPIHSLGGFRLDMTSDEVLKEKGRPILQDNVGWVYNAIDSKHDGVLTLFFSHPSQSETGPVFAIEFMGHDQASAPAEIPYLNSLSTADVILKYGEPIARRPAPQGNTFLWFRNGIYIGTRNGKVYSYGIFDLAQLQN
jgi:hypothetical protein